MFSDLQSSPPQFYLSCYNHLFFIHQFYFRNLYLNTFFFLAYYFLILHTFSNSNSCNKARQQDWFHRVFSDAAKIDDGLKIRMKYISCGIDFIRIFCQIFSTPEMWKEIRDYRYENGRFQSFLGLNNFCNIGLKLGMNLGCAALPNITHDQAIQCGSSWKNTHFFSFWWFWTKTSISQNNVFWGCGLIFWPKQFSNISKNGSTDFNFLSHFLKNSLWTYLNPKWIR